ncbi:MAG: RNA-binding S4 domain-containing protein [Aquabacterium sp.]|jgi:ribosome-associated heat shock protein Hsp15|nr:MAG: RNA-binding S4 domain-containing protein [Aquabacterium sp.]
MSSLASLRLDKWLWAARFHKTRSLAVEDINRGRVQVNGQPAKPSRELHVGDRLDVRGHDGLVRTLRVLGLSSIRGPAPAAQALYEETPESLQRREQHAEQRRLAHEPAQAIEHGRPTKRDRRQLADWQRWSASSDEQGR